MYYYTKFGMASMAGSDPQDYELGIDPNAVRNGKHSGYLKAKGAEPRGFGTMMQKFKANDYLNKRMRFSAFVKSEGIEAWAGLWMRVDGPQQGSLRFDNMQNRPIKGTTDWHKYDVVLERVRVRSLREMTEPEARACVGWPRA